MARSTVSDREVRSMVASPIRSDGVPPIRSRVEKALLPLLGQEPDVESGLPLGAQVGHLGQLGVTDRRAILGLHLDGHMSFRTPRSPCVSIPRTG
jgi:hypothetical protein